jgi:hypothetical protein
MTKKSSPTHSASTKNGISGVDGNAVKNRILMSLPGKECDFLFPRLTLVNLELHDLLLEAGHPIEHCYFPNTAMGSILNIAQDGKSVEVISWQGGLRRIAADRRI